MQKKKKKKKTFKNVLLNAQDKVICNKITEIRKERNANSIYTGSTTSHAYVQAYNQNTPVRHSFYAKVWIFFIFSTLVWKECAKGAFMLQVIYKIHF